MVKKEKIKVLVVDDEQVIRDLLSRVLTFEGLIVKCADDGLKAIEAAERERFDIVFLDIKMPKMNGLEIFSMLRKIDPKLSCVFMTGYALEAALLDKTKQPGVICLKKPFEDISQIKNIANSLLEEARSMSVVNGYDRRAYVRLNDSLLGIDYRIKQGQGRIDSSPCKNISPVGIKLIVSEPLASGVILELAMKFPGCNETLSASAKVVWSRKSEDKPDFYDTGVKFVEIDFSKFAGLFTTYGEVFTKG